MITQPRESRIEELRKRIAELEAIIGRNPTEEEELQDKKKELAELEKQQEGSFKKYLPWIIGGGIILVLAIVIIYLLMRDNKRPKK